VKLRSEVVERVLSDRTKARVRDGVLAGMYFWQFRPDVGARAYRAVRHRARSVPAGETYEAPFTRRGDMMKLRAGTTDGAIYEQIFLMRDCAVPFSIDPALIIDAGAHVGCSALFFADQYPNAKIIAVEAEGANYAMLEANVASNPNIESIHAAVWKDNTPVRLQNPDDPGWGFRVEGSPSSEAVGDLEIPAVTIDDLLARSGMQDIDLLKLDIEGAEREVFMADCDAWLSKTKTIVIELHDRMKPGCREAFFAALARYDHTVKETRHNLVVQLAPLTS
jgi:FkbM family methyltransferase